MTQQAYTRKEIKRLKPEVIARLREAAKRRSVPDFRKILDEIAGELSLERTAELIVEFKQYADAWSAARKRR
ncbi:MAG TPA: hypothetical protein VN872_07710 [Candidatus Acidoferrum sp.]|nr:hypothetical protein [Candidatus Acidoferrum sp.]